MNVVAAVAAVGLLAVMPGVGAANAAGATAGGHHGGGCPAAESLVPGTSWHHHTLANGVTMAAGLAKDAEGTVNMHVLRVDLRQPRVHVVTLEHKVADRLPLSVLAHGHPQLVAATNTGYFDFDTGAPTDPLVVNGKAQVLSTRHETVVAVGKDRRVEAAQVWLSGKVTAGNQSQPVTALNEPFPPDGIGIYDSRWGAARAPRSWSAVNRAVVHGVLTAGSIANRNPTVPANGFLVQARGRSAANWLRGLSVGTRVSFDPRMATNAASPLVQAYGVGVQLVSQPGVAKTGFSCGSSNTKQPARTAIGWANHGRTLIVAVVADHPHTSMHGLDEDQMSKLMAQLGVSRAYAFDGSGSTELLAKLKGSSLPAIQNYLADAAERPMPVGLGFAVAPAKHHAKRHHKRH